MNQSSASGAGVEKRVRNESTTGKRSLNLINKVTIRQRRFPQRRKKKRPYEEGTITKKNCQTLSANSCALLPKDSIQRVLIVSSLLPSAQFHPCWGASKTDPGILGGLPGLFSSRFPWLHAERKGIKSFGRKPISERSHHNVAFVSLPKPTGGERNANSQERYPR